MRVLVRCVLSGPQVNLNGRAITPGGLENGFRRLGNGSLPVMSNGHNGYPCGRLVKWSFIPLSRCIEGIALIDGSDILCKGLLDGTLRGVSIGYQILASHPSGDIQMVDDLVPTDIAFAPYGANLQATVREVMVLK